jgi:uncharacterized OB-fold protein
MSQASQAPGAGSIMTATHVIEYPYTRSLGPALSRFLTGLRDGRIYGSKTLAGVVHVPPMEFDPATAETLEEFVEVADEGVLTSWTWIEAPGENHRRDKPFAFALIRLDGADGSLLHIVDAEGPEALSTGMRVKARWAAERQGSIHDIEGFEPA